MGNLPPINRSYPRQNIPDGTHNGTSTLGITSIACGKALAVGKRSGIAFAGATALTTGLGAASGSFAKNRVRRTKLNTLRGHRGKGVPSNAKPLKQDNQWRQTKREVVLPPKVVPSTL